MSQKRSYTKKVTQKEKFYSPYLSSEEINEGVRNQRFFIGTLRILNKQPKYGFVSVTNFTNDIVIFDMKDRNRAFHGDVVAIELYPTSEWTEKGNHSASKTTNSNSEERLPTLETLEIQDSTQALWRPREDLLQNQFNDNENENENENENNQNEKDNNESLKGTNQSIDLPGRQPKGRVVGIIRQSSHKGIMGSINLNGRDPSKSFLDQAAFVTFIPADARYPHLIVTKSHLPDEFLANPLAMSSSTIFLADISSEWPVDSKLAFGENVRAVGQVGDIAAETEALLTENGLNHGPYSNEILESLMEFLKSENNLDELEGNWRIPDEEILKRRDYRFNRRIFTIDPPNARDLDDALHITPLDILSSTGKQFFEVGVHIADVSYFVSPQTALDLEARFRATSVYLVQKVIPMLPRILCEQLCSLNPNVDRLAFSVVFILTEDGDLAEGFTPWYGRTVIRSCAKLDYGTAQRIVDGAISFIPDTPFIPVELWEPSRRPTYSKGDGESIVTISCRDVANDVCLLHKVAMSRRKRRLANGALVLTRPKMTFQLDANGNPESTRPYPIKESNQLIEEYMLLGNYLVAEKLLETVGSLAFLRHHPPPNTEGMDLLVHFADTLGYDLDITSSSTLQRSLSNIQSNNSIRGHDDLISQVISSLLMKPMNRAKYMIAGDGRTPVDKQNSTNTPNASTSSTTTTSTSSTSSTSSSISKQSRWRHYALSIPYYTHFTSPIRRYADVMVHRLLEEGLKREQEGKLNTFEDKAVTRNRMNTLIEIADHCNSQKEAAKTAQDRSDIVFLSVFLMRSPQRNEGVVVDMAEKSFTILILSFALEQRIYIDKIGVGVGGGGGGSVGVGIGQVGGNQQREGGQVTGRYDEENKILTLVNSQPVRSPLGERDLNFSTLELRLMSRVAVYLSANTTPPISVRVELLGSV